MSKTYKMLPIDTTASQRPMPLVEPYNAYLDFEGTGICGFKLILSSFWHENCADVLVLHDILKVIYKGFF